MNYQVKLDTYCGPLDLLLDLVERDEVDVLEISIAQLAEQFVTYLQVLTELDLEYAGEFLVMAATLMEIKSQMLLPSDRRGADRSTESGSEPRRELVRQLLRYRKYKEAAASLEHSAERQAACFPRTIQLERTATDRPAVRAVELWDLVGAFARMLRETQLETAAAIVIDDTPQHDYEELLRNRLRRELRVPFLDLFEPPHTRSRLLGLFLALLELVRRFELWVEQPEPFGPIWLSVPH